MSDLSKLTTEALEKMLKLHKDTHKGMIVLGDMVHCLNAKIELLEKKIESFDPNSPQS